MREDELTRALLVCAFALTSCRGAVLDGGRDETPDGGIAPIEASRCVAPAASDPPPEDTAAFTRRLAGTWRRCGPAERGILRFAAIEIFDPRATAASWRALEGNEPGSPLPGDPPSEHGVCSVREPSTAQFVFENAARSTVVLFFEDGDRRFRIVQSGFDPTNVVYVRSP
jgi:hypothetical protein